MINNTGIVKCIHRHTEKTHPRCFVNGVPIVRVYPMDMEIKPSKVLVLDIETLPILTYTWGVWNQNIYPKQVVKDWCVLSYAVKWLGDSRVISDVLTSREAVMRDDQRLVTNLWKLLDEADVVIAHNGKRFDMRKLNTRFWRANLHKPSSYKIIDTLTVARSIFGLTYNKLDYIAKFIGADEKLETDFSLWARCDYGHKSALQEMKTYNEQDISTLEQVYLSMREWIPNHPDLGIYQNLEGVCPVCLSTNIKEIGLYTANKLQYKEHRCSKCYSTWHNTKAIGKENKE